MKYKIFVVFGIFQIVLIHLIFGGVLLFIGTKTLVTWTMYMKYYNMYIPYILSWVEFICGLILVVSEMKKNKPI